MSKGNTAFNQGKYSEARTYYATAKQCAGGNPTEAQKKIAACDAKIKVQKEAAEAKRKAEAEAAERRRIEDEATQRTTAGIRVLSFKRDDTDLEALTKSVKDDNAQTCALLKIITTETGFVIEPDGNGFCKEIEYKTAEIRVWLPPGSRRITIKNLRFGQLRDYVYPEAIQAAKVYVMELQNIDFSSPSPSSNSEDDVTSNYMAMTVTPSDVMVKIDGEIVAVNNGEFYKMYPLGKHKYEAYADMYYPKEGTFDITAKGTTNLSIELKPKFGYVEILSLPETGALVYVNGEKVGVTPYKSDKMESGTYKVELIRDMFKNTTHQVTVNDDKTTKVTFDMSPNFAEPVFVCLDEDAEIWVDGERKGKKNWTGRLSAGPHRVETKKTITALLRN